MSRKFNSESISQWNPSYIISRSKKLQNELDTQIENEHQEIRKGYPGLSGGPHYNGAADGWYRSTHEKINNLAQEKKEVKRMEKQLLKTTVSIAPYTRVAKIPKNTLDKSIRDSGFEFFRADFGMNINVPVGKLKEIRFYLSLIGDRKVSEHVQIVSGFPNDLIEKINIVSGTVKIAINDFMNIIPVSMIQSVSKIIKIDLNPWNFNWNYKRVKVLFSEGLSYKADWYLSSKNLNQDFNCTIILKKRIGVKQVIGRVKAIWSYEPPSQNENIIRRLMGMGKNQLKMYMENKDISVIPIA